MELDDFKSSWETHSQELNKNLALNINALKEENFIKSQNELLKPLLHEIANIFVIGLTILFIAISSFKYLNEYEFSIPGITAVILGTINVYYAIIKTHRIYNIDYYSSSIVELQKKVSSLHLLILKFRKVETTLFPFFILCVLPITFKAIQHRNLYAELNFFLPLALLIIAIGLLGTYLINKYLYDNKITKIQLFLEELRSFENEETDDIKSSS